MEALMPMASQYLDTHMEFAYVYSKLIIVCAHVLSLV